MCTLNKIQNECWINFLKVISATTFLFLLSYVPITSNFSESFATAREINSISKSPLPNWVSDIAVPAPLEPRYDQLQDGRYFLLASYQHRFLNQKRYNYSRYAIKIVNREGLENNSNITFSFRPDIDEVTIHRLIIHRDGREIDLLDQINFEVFQRENDLERGILDGTLTAFANIPSVRVGDTIEYAFSRDYKSILMSDEFYTDFNSSFSVPVGTVEYRVIVPQELNLQTNYLGKVHKPTVEKISDEQIYTWLLEDLDPVISEDNTPSWYPTYDSIEVSSITSWSDVISDSISHYPPVDELPQSFKEKIEAIRAKYADPKLQISAVLSLVQNEIRYVGIEIGRGAFIPRPPELVLARGYGDCKDKSYLLVTALRMLGLDARPAYAHLSDGQNLIDRLPSPYVFDHAIVQVRLDGNTYWLDPTGTQQYDPDPAFSQADYGYALPISVASDGLAKIVPVTITQPQTVVSENITLSYDPEENPLKLAVESIYKGKDADTFRYNLARNGKSHYSRNYLEYYQHNYPGLEVEVPLEVLDDKATNIIKLLESYTLPVGTDRSKIFEDLYLRGDAVRSVLSKINSVNRSTPISIDFPIFREHRVKVEGLAGPLAPVDSVSISEPFLDYEVTSEAKATELSITWKLRTKASYVPVKDIESYEASYDKIQETDGWYYDVRESNLAAGTVTDKSEPIAGNWFILSLMILGLPLLVRYSRKWGRNAANS